MTASTDAVRSMAIQFEDSAVDDNLTALAGGAQGAAPRLKAKISRFTRVATAADSCQLPSLLDGENGGSIRIVINDTANALAVFPRLGSGDTINALSATTALSVPAGQSAIFIPPAAQGAAGAIPSTGNWRAAVIP